MSRGYLSPIRVQSIAVVAIVSDAVVGGDIIRVGWATACARAVEDEAAGSPMSSRPLEVRGEEERQRRRALEAVEQHGDRQRLAPRRPPPGRPVRRRSAGRAGAPRRPRRRGTPPRAARARAARASRRRRCRAACRRRSGPGRRAAPTFSSSVIRFSVFRTQASALRVGGGRGGGRRGEEQGNEGRVGSRSRMGGFYARRKLGQNGRACSRRLAILAVLWALLAPAASGAGDDRDRHRHGHRPDGGGAPRASPSPRATPRTGWSKEVDDHRHRPLHRALPARGRVRDRLQPGRASSPYAAQGVTLHVNDRLTVDATLSVAGRETAIEVAVRAARAIQPTPAVQTLMGPLAGAGAAPQQPELRPARDPRPRRQPPRSPTRSASASPAPSRSRSRARAATPSTGSWTGPRTWTWARTSRCSRRRPWSRSRSSGSSRRATPRSGRAAAAASSTW